MFTEQQKQQNLNGSNENETMSKKNIDTAFHALAELTTQTLIKSDMRRDAIGKESGAQSTSATNWIDDHSAFVLQQALEKVYIPLPDQRDLRLDRDEASAWLRWIKSAPVSDVIGCMVQLSM